MRLIEMLKTPKYFALAVIATAIVLVAEQFLSSGTAELSSSVLPVAFAALFGATLAFQIYIRLTPSQCTCDNSKKLKGLEASSAGTLGMLVAAQCPACTYVGVMLLPVSAAGFLSQYNWIISLLSIGLLLFALNYLGAFKE